MRIAYRYFAGFANNKRHNSAVIIQTSTRSNKISSELSLPSGAKPNHLSIKSTAATFSCLPVQR
jgi:hypothetical protein